MIPNLDAVPTGKAIFTQLNLKLSDSLERLSNELQEGQKAA